MHVILRVSSLAGCPHSIVHEANAGAFHWAHAGVASHSILDGGSGPASAHYALVVAVLPSLPTQITSRV